MDLEPTIELCLDVIHLSHLANTLPRCHFGHTLTSIRGIGYWSVKFGLYGAKDVVRAHFEELKRIIGKKVPQQVHRLQGQIFSGESDELLEATSIPDPHGGFFVGIPSLWSLPMVRYRLPKEKLGIGAHADYSPIIPSDGKTVLEWVTTARKVCESEGFDLFCDFFMHERHVIFVNMMVFDKSNPEHRRATDAIFRGLYKEGRNRGFSKYRSHINYMGMFLPSKNQTANLRQTWWRTPSTSMIMHIEDL
jgi:hypothetical protein